MTRKEIAAMFARREEAYEEMDANALAADYADDAVIESPTAGTHTGPAAAAHAFDGVFHAFADMTRHPESLLIDDDSVAQVLTMEGTNLGGLMGLPPSGKHFRVPAVFLYELRGNKIVHERRIYDFSGMLVQVGTLSGADTGGFMGMVPSGRPALVPNVFVCRAADGLIVHERRIYDFTGMLVQIGVLKAKPA